MRNVSSGHAAPASIFHLSAWVVFVLVQIMMMMIITCAGVDAIAGAGRMRLWVWRVNERLDRPLQRDFWF